MPDRRVQLGPEGVKKVFTLAVLIALGGCSLFGFDGFSGGDQPSDGGAADQATSDGPASIDDGGLTNDGGGEASPGGPFCKTTGADAAVCDDFEEPGTFTGKWSSKDTYLGTLEVIDGAGIGATRGLRFSATPRADGQVGQDGRVMLAWTSPGAVSFLDAELAVKTTSIPPTTYAAGPLYVEFERADGGRARLGFILDGSRQIATNPTMFLGDGGVVGLGGKIISTLPLSTYTRIRLVADLAKSPAAFYVYVDGTLMHEQALGGFVPGKAHVSVGADYVGTTDGGTVTMDLDDARISWK